MSWVSVGCTAASVAAAGCQGRRVPFFASCSYCQKAPDQDQKEANCRSCGAPLRKQDSHNSTVTWTPPPLVDRIVVHHQKEDDMQYSKYQEERSKRRREEEELQSKRRREEEESRQKRNREEDDRRVQNIAMGDMMNTGIPGGIDMNITTPW